MNAPEVDCKCKSCECRTSCEFYNSAVQPVINVLEDEYLDRTDPVIRSYLDKLSKVIEKFYCDQYE